MDTLLTKPASSPTADLGRRVRAARIAHSLTLETASRLCGVSRSTLSKIENGLMSPTFDVLQKIVLSLKIDLGELFGSAPKPNASGRRALTRKDAGQRHAYRGYQMELLATDLAHKAMLPFRIRITAHSLDAFDDWGRHEGEEFLYVISGSVCLYSELYAPTHLSAGDSLYFDSRTGHAAISTSDEDAEVLWMATSAETGHPPAEETSTAKAKSLRPVLDEAAGAGPADDSDEPAAASNGSVADAKASSKQSAAGTKLRTTRAARGGEVEVAAQTPRVKTRARTKPAA